MTNFNADVNGVTTYTEPEGSLIYRGQVVLSADHAEEGRVGLCMSAYGGGDSVTVGIGDEADVQQFLYEAAVRSKLIKDGDPLILMKKIEEEDAA